MASDSIPVVPEITSKVQDRMGDAHSKDWKHSNSSQRENFQGYYKPSSLTFLEHSSASPTPALETIANEPDTFIKSTPDDPVSTFSEINLHVEANFSKESEEGGEISTENQNISSVKISNDLLLSKEVDTILPIISDETESSEVIQHIEFEENELKEVIQPALSEENESSQVIQPALFEETESTRVIKPDLSEETESTQEIKPALSEESVSIRVIQSPLFEEIEVIKTPVFEDTASTIVIQPVTSEKTESAELIQPHHSEETKLMEVKQTVISEEFNLNKVTEFHPLESSCCVKSVSSPESRKAQIPSNDINQSAVPEILSKGFSEITLGLSNFKENYNLSYPPAFDPESFLSLLNTDEYRNGSHFSFPGAGQVIVSPSSPCEPIFPDFEMPPLSPPIKNPPIESIKHLSPAKDATVTKDIGSNTCLSTLLSIIADWVQRGMEKCLNTFEKPDNVNFINDSKRELKFGLDLLKHMSKRVETLLRAAEGLPDPTSIFPHELRSEGISIRDSLKYAGVVVQRRLEALKAESTLGYKRFVSLFPNDAKLNNSGFGSKELATNAQEIIFHSFVKLSEDFLKLSMDTEKFRDQIRDFCLEIDMLL